MSEVAEPKEVVMEAPEKPSEPAKESSSASPSAKAEPNSTSEPPEPSKPEQQKSSSPSTAEPAKPTEPEAKAAEPSQEPSEKSQEPSEKSQEPTEGSKTPSSEAPPPAEAQPSSSSAPVAAEAVEDSIYQVKWVRGGGGEALRAVVTQNENGPCPLLAIVNVLLARGQISLPDGAEVASAGQLMGRLGDCILRLAPPEMAESLRQDYEANVSDAVAVLAKLATGIDVNVRFGAVRDFEYTRECIVFDLLNIPLYHGWIVDEAAEADVARLLKGKSYNQAVEELVSKDGAGSSAVAEWLEATKSQLTYPGLCQLHATLRDGELAVLFRNNHFATLLKNRDELFTLVTDAGFLEKPRVVWETLASVDGGDSHFVDAAFHSFVATERPPKPVPVPTTGSGVEAEATGGQEAEAKPLSAAAQIHSDYELALSLQAGEEAQSPAQTQAPTANRQMEPLPLAGVNADEVDWNSGKHPVQSPLGPGSLLPDELLALELQRQEDQRAQGGRPQPHRRGSHTPAASPTGSGGKSPKEDKCTLL